VRIVRTPDGRVVLDPTGRVAGRGAYLCADGSCWRIALQKGTIARALNAQLPPEITEHLNAGPVTVDARARTLDTMTNQGDMRGEK
jgi:predicted RNA-binding protein YlxR (DUF448 family)